MSLTAGTRLGPYEVLGLIGAGGMGEVYKARDTRLDRSVAIKVLPTELASDAERRTRFEREARTISTLNHPHICTLYDVGDRDGVPYLVMEHLAGETLGDRLKKGPLPLDQVLDFGAQIADALSAAHKHGIVHRDLKPANVMLTKAGAKLLDFGLAKPHAHDLVGEGATRASRATVAEPLTERGVILGTVPYMAPEQVEGRPADARTDLWALGAILYEMLTGRRAFEGQSAASLIGNIMTAEPTPLLTLQPLTPPLLDRLVRKCLAKSPDDRPDTAHDVADDLRWLADADALRAGSPGPASATRWPTIAWTALAFLAIAAGAGVLWRVGLGRVPSPTTVRSELNVRPADELNSGAFTSGWMPTPGGSRTALAWTPDGQALVFVGRRAGVRQIYVRRLEDMAAQPVPATEGARAFTLSADGRWVAFVVGRILKKAPLSGGGPAVDIAAGVSDAVFGLFWGATGDLYFGAGDNQIWRTSALGTVQPVTASEPGLSLRHMLPYLLPGGRVLLDTVRKQNMGIGQEEVVAQTLATGQRRTLLRDAADARFVAPSYLVFLRRGTLHGVAFDLDRVETKGTPVPLVEGVAQATVATRGTDVSFAGQFAIASTGALAWVPGPPPARPDHSLVTVDRLGRVSPIAVPPRSYGFGVRLSPDGQSLRVGIQDLTGERPWTYDLNRGTLTLVRGEGEVSYPLWSPDGRRVVYTWFMNGRWSLAWQRADGAGEPPVVLAPGLLTPSSWTPDARQLAVVTADGDLALVTSDEGKAVVQVLEQTTHVEMWPEFSPDGRWLAYGSNESGRFEIYVRPYPGPGPATQVSSNGGESPAWRRDGRELFYIEAPTGASWGEAAKVTPPRMVSVTFEAGVPPRLGRPHELFAIEPGLGVACTPARCYDVSSDGQRFFMMQDLAQRSVPPMTHINLVQNWVEELKAKVPVN